MGFKEFKKRIKEELSWLGKDYEWLAKSSFLDVKKFQTKMNGIVKFKQEEVDSVMRVLGMDLEELIY